jgi:hypothetical protein
MAALFYAIAAELGRFRLHQEPRKALQGSACDLRQESIHYLLIS